MASGVHVSGSFEIKAPPVRVWDSLWDPKTLPVWIPGCIRAEWSTADTAEVEVEQTVALLKARFAFELAVVGREAPRYARVAGSGAAPALGSGVTMDGTLTLEPGAVADTTLAQYEVDVQVTGRLATVGHFILTSKAKELQREVARRVKQQLENGSSPP